MNRLRQSHFCSIVLCISCEIIIAVYFTRLKMNSESNTDSVKWVTMLWMKRQAIVLRAAVYWGTAVGALTFDLVFQVSVGHIVPGGSADLDGRLRKNDEIIHVDGQSVISSSHHRVVQLMTNAALNGRVTLGIRRRLNAFPGQWSALPAVLLLTVCPFSSSFWSLT